MCEEYVRIGPVWYKIIMVGRGELDPVSRKTDEEPDISGESRPAECELLINRDHHRQQQVISLFHEVFHVLLGQAGKECESSDEELINVLTHGILQVLADNPWMSDLAVRWFETPVVI